MTHTPGPWKVGRWGLNHFDKTNHLHFVSDGSLQIAQVEGMGDEYMANAFLIAAAPELLEVCRFALAYVEELREAFRTGSLSNLDGKGALRSNTNVAVENNLRYAIAKATGEDAT